MNNSANLKAEWVERIFMLLHGRFGNTFFNKFKIGKLNADGDDAGLANAKMVWSSELSGVSPERLKAGLEANYDHAPSCDDFKRQCVVKTAVSDYKALPAPIDYEANKAYAANVVDFIAKNTVDKTDYKAWAKRIIANPAKFPNASLIIAKEALGA